MKAQLMVKPSYFMQSGIEMKEFGNIYLFRFTLDHIIPKSLGGLVLAQIL